MIFTDGIHLVSNKDIEELHSFAEKIGLKKEWFQDHKKYKHYDLFGNKTALAISNGAKLVTAREIVNLFE